MSVAGHDVDLHVAVDGRAGAPPLLLIHGIISSHRTWDWLVPEVAAEWGVHRMDLRGHGLSGRAPGRYFPTDFLSDAVAVCRRILSTTGQQPVVIGHSLGGLVTTGLIQQHPHLLRAAVLEDPALRLPVEDPSVNLLEGSALLELFRVIRRVVPRTQQSGMSEAELAAALATTKHGDGRPILEVMHPDVLDGWAYAQLHLDASVLDPLIDGTQGPDAASMVDLDAPFDVPTLLLAPDPSAADGIVGAAVLDLLAQASPQMRCEVIEGASHGIHDDRRGREPFLQHVLGFLDEVRR